MFVTICIGGVANGIEGVLEPFIQCIRYSAIFCMGFFLILQRARQSCEEELDWKVYFISVKTEFAE